MRARVPLCGALYVTACTVCMRVYACAQAAIVPAGAYRGMITDALARERALGAASEGGAGGGGNGSVPSPAAAVQARATVSSATFSPILEASLADVAAGVTAISVVGCRLNDSCAFRLAAAMRKHKTLTSMNL